MPLLVHNMKLFLFIVLLIVLNDVICAIAFWSVFTNLSAVPSAALNHSGFNSTCNSKPSLDAS